MENTASLDLDDIVDGQSNRKISTMLAFLAMLVLISDGFDISVVGLISPQLLAEWRIQPTSLVPAFTAGVIGMMMGGPLFGMLGDRHGRRRMLRWGLLVVGCGTLATIAAASLTWLVALRFVTGLGLGGVLPNAIALIAELAPRRQRGPMIVIVTTGMILGMLLAGLAMSTIGGRYGWRYVMLVGGILPILVAILAGSIPESIKYLIARGGRDREVIDIARRLRPDLSISYSTKIRVSHGEPSARPLPIKLLLSGEFRIVTPLLWTILAMTQVAGFFVITWLPMLLQSVGSVGPDAGAAIVIFSVGGLASSLLLFYVFDKSGAVPLVLLLSFGALFMAFTSAGETAFIRSVTIFLTGFCVLGAQLAATATIGLAYPTTLRSFGTGVAQSIGRIGAAMAPVLGGILLGAHIRPHYLMFCPAVAALVGAAASAWLVLLCRRKFGGLRMREFTCIP